MKIPITDDGGLETADSWTLSASSLTGDDSRDFSNPGGSGAFKTVYANVGYDLSESIVAGYVTGNWSCVGGDLQDSTITLGLNEHVTCEIVNDDIAPTLTIVKAADGMNYPDVWSYSGFSAFDLDGTGGSTTPYILKANQNYSVAEDTYDDGDDSTAWVLTDISCDDVPATTGSLTNRDITVDLALDEDLTCTFTNKEAIISITKTFADDSVIAGGLGSSFDLVVTNDGFVDLENVLVTDTVDSRLTVTGVTGTSGADADTDGNDQTVEWLIPSLGIGESATITVDFEVGPSVEEANGVGGLNDEDNVPNTATVSGDYIDDEGTKTSVNDDDSDSIDILVEIELEIVKTFFRYDDDGNRVEDGQVEQGTEGFFELVVTNRGPSDAVGVVVTDAINGLFTELSIVEPNSGCELSGQTSGEQFVNGLALLGELASEPAFSGSTLNCEFDIPVDSSKTVVISYQAAEFLDPDDGPQFGTVEGDEFRFVFVNGYVLEGSSDTDGSAILYLTDPDGNTQTLDYLGTKNDFPFDPPGDDPAFTIHISCSDPFTGGWGSGGDNGPVEFVDVNWQIASYSILRYNQNGFFKGCGDVVVPFDVPNTAFADGTDSNSPPESELVSATASVTVIRQLKIEIRNEPVTKGKKMDVLLNNTGEDPLIITMIELIWPDSNDKDGNGELVEVLFGNNTIYNTPESASPATIIGPWVGTEDDRTIDPREALKLGFYFARKTVPTGYTVRVTLEGGLTTEVTEITK